MNAHFVFIRGFKIISLVEHLSADLSGNKVYALYVPDVFFRFI